MRICLANDSFPPQYDGVANTVVNYAQILHRQYGASVVAAPYYPDCQDAFPFPVVRYDSLNTERMVGYRTGFPFDAEAMRQLREFQPELIHCHCPMASLFLCRELRKLTDRPLILTYHTKFDIDIKRAVKLGFIQEAAIRGLIENIESADEVWAVNRGAGENLKQLGFARDYILMPNGVDMPRQPAEEAAQRELDELYHLDRSVPLFLFVGRVVWYKGLKITLDGLKGLREKGYDFRMAIVGNGDDFEDVKRYAREAGVADRCIFPGSERNREKLRAWYSRADLFLLPSVFDNNPLVVKEAAACGTASVLIRDSSSAEGAADGVDSFLIPESGEAMTAVLEEVCRDRALAQRLGEGAASNLFVSWDDSVARAVKRYEEILRAKQSGELPKRQAKFDSLVDTAAELFLAMEQLRNSAKRLQSEESQEWKHFASQMREFFSSSNSREMMDARKGEMEELHQKVLRIQKENTGSTEDEHDEE